MLAVQARAVAGLRHHAARHGNAEVVVVSHADVIKAVLAHFVGAPLDLMHRIEIGPGSISQLMLSAEDAQVLTVNIHP
jgi:probable phosphoglycerate mutase